MKGIKSLKKISLYVLVLLLQFFESTQGCENPKKNKIDETKIEEYEIKGDCSKTEAVKLTALKVKEDTNNQPKHVNAVRHTAKEDGYCQGKGIQAIGEIKPIKEKENSRKVDVFEEEKSDDNNQKPEGSGSGFIHFIETIGRCINENTEIKYPINIRDIEEGKLENLIFNYWNTLNMNDQKFYIEDDYFLKSCINTNTNEICIARDVAQELAHECRLYPCYLKRQYEGKIIC